MGPRGGASPNKFFLVHSPHPGLVASSLARHTHSHARTLNCFAFFPTDFGGRERLLAVQSIRGCNAETVSYPTLKRKTISSLAGVFPSVQPL